MRGLIIPLALISFGLGQPVRAQDLKVPVAVRKTLDQFQQMPQGLVVKPACPPARPATPIPQADLCANPAKYVCDTGYNPFLQKSMDNHALFQSLQTQSEGASDSNKSREATLHDLLYTKPRTDAATLLFNRAKSTILTHLKSELISVSKNGSPDEIATLNQMIQTMSDTQFVVGPMPGESSQYNAHYESVPKSAFYLEGLIVAIDTNPESVYEVMLHELSHSIGPTGIYRKDANLTGNPFGKSMQCLRDPHSAGVKSGDLACFEDLQKKYAKDPVEGKRLAFYVNALKASSDTSYSVTQGLPEAQCQMGQLGEAFADWMATESYAQENASALESPPSGVTANKIIDLKSRLLAHSKLADFFSENCDQYLNPSTASMTRDQNKDSHPLMKDRINDIMLANPILNAAIGCPSDSNRIYCGNEALP